MTGKRFPWILLLAIVAGFVAALVASCGPGDKTVPSEVPATWESARVMEGHVAHLGKNTADGKPIECKDCHDVDAEGFKSPGTKPCARCHANEDTHHHKGDVAKPTSCLDCHAFVQKDHAAAKAIDCTRCHAVQNGGKLAHHATDKSKCITCHSPHGTPSIVAADCVSCHVDVGAKHGKLVVETPGESGVPSNAALAATHAHVCTACHAPHEASTGALGRCHGCHATNMPPSDSPLAGELTPLAPKITLVPVEGHPLCIRCHKPHDAVKADVVPCTQCHAAKKDVAMISGHARCIGCHAPHAPAGGGAACTQCHGEHPALAASKVTAHHVCTSCHDPHRPTLSPATACVRCHANVHPNHAPATEGPDGCIKCHSPHPASSAIVVRTCTGCHSVAKDDHALHAAKAACTECHTPHEFDLSKLGTALCARCHSAIAAKVEKPGHATCANCHGKPHTPTRDVDCGACHKEEHASTPKGHTVCTTCHEPHSATLLANGAAFPKPSPATIAGFCGSCHADKPKAQHGSIATGCTSCHRPHGPNGPASPPPCTSCHAPASLPGLHAIPAHANKCASCHTAHGPPSSDRATCTTGCHVDRRTHQPDAAVCKGCHVFRT